MKKRSSREGEGSKGKIDAPKSISMKQKKKRNMMRLGGTGLSLEAFANAKSPRSHYNPALIKKQRGFYKNAKYVSKFKKNIKHQSQQDDLSLAARPLEEPIFQEENPSREDGKMTKKSKNKKRASSSLRELYEKQHQEAEKARLEREAVIKAKREEREKAEARRKAERGKMLKKTKHGQPLMKYRIENLLQTIQGTR